MNPLFNNQEEEERDRQVVRKLFTSKDITEAWNEAEGLSTSFQELDDEDLVICREDLHIRAKKIMHLLSFYVDTDHLEKNKSITINHEYKRIDRQKD